MKNIFLSGGGDAIVSKVFDKNFLKLLPKEPILYIPLAMKPSKYPSCYEWVTTTFPHLNIEMCTDLTKVKSLNNYGAVYVGGGNTFELLQKIRDSNFDKLLLPYLNKGGIYYGGSAGAIILGKTIETSFLGKIKDKNTIKMTNFQGLNLIDDYSIHCHHEEDEDEQVQEFANKGNKVLALPEGTGLHITDKINFIGKGIKEF